MMQLYSFRSILGGITRANFRESPIGRSCQKFSLKVSTSSSRPRAGPSLPTTGTGPRTTSTQKKTEENSIFTSVTFLFDKPFLKNLVSMIIYCSINKVQFLVTSYY